MIEFGHGNVNKECASIRFIYNYNVRSICHNSFITQNIVCTSSIKKNSYCVICIIYIPIYYKIIIITIFIATGCGDIFLVCTYTDRRIIKSIENWLKKKNFKYNSNLLHLI